MRSPQGPRLGLALWGLCPLGHSLWVSGMAGVVQGEVGHLVDEESTGCGWRSVILCNGLCPASPLPCFGP